MSAHETKPKGPGFWIEFYRIVQGKGASRPLYSTLSPRAQALLPVLFSRIRPGHSRAIGMRRLVADLGWHHRAVKKALNELKERGLVSFEASPVAGTGGKRSRVVYTRPSTSQQQAILAAFEASEAQHGAAGPDDVWAGYDGEEQLP